VIKEGGATRKRSIQRKEERHDKSEIDNEIIVQSEMRMIEEKTLLKLAY